MIFFFAQTEGLRTFFAPRIYAPKMCASLIFRVTKILGVTCANIEERKFPHYLPRTGTKRTK